MEKTTTQFCFTYAIDGGAWVIFPGEKQATWLSYAQIEKKKGKGWFERMRAKQGMFTGAPAHAYPLLTANQTLWTNDHREWYRSVYLHSDHWRELRARKLANNPRCQRCGAKAGDVHHRRYRSIFDVQLRDLESLCRKCHKAEHRRNGTPRRRKPRPSKFRISEEQRLVVGYFDFVHDS